MLLTNIEYIPQLYHNVMSKLKIYDISRLDPIVWDNFNTYEKKMKGSSESKLQNQVLRNYVVIVTQRGAQITGGHVTRAPKFCTVAPNICGL